MYNRDKNNWKELTQKRKNDNKDYNSWKEPTHKKNRK